MSRRKKRQTDTSIEDYDRIEAEDENETVRPKLSDFMVNSFDPNTEDWEYYSQRFKVCLSACKISDEQYKRDLLLAKLSPEPFKILVDHYRPRSVQSVPIDEIFEFLDKFYGNVSSPFAERCVFSRRYQLHDETIGQFTNELRRMAGKCDFGPSLDERLRDQLIVGLSDDFWQQEVIRKFPTVQCSFKDVEQFVSSMELSKQQQHRMKKMDKEESKGVCNIQSSSKNHRTPMVLVRRKQCFRCGNALHKKISDCPAANALCTACNKRGHFLKTCLVVGNATVQEVKGKGNRAAYYVHEDSTSPQESDTEDVCITTSNLIRKTSRGKEVVLEVKLNKVKLQMLYDPGAASSIIGKETWLKIGKPELKPTPDLTAYTGLKVKALGKTTLNVEAFDQQHSLSVIVVEKEDIPLFGLDWVFKFNLPLPPGAKIRNIAVETENVENSEIKSLLTNYKSIFSDGLGLIVGHEAKINLTGEAVPKVFKARPVPLALRSAVEKELERLVEAGVIEPVDPMKQNIEWASPIVTAMKKNGKIRVCADFRVSLNKFLVLDKYPFPKFEDLVDRLLGGQQFSVIDLRDAYLQLKVEESSQQYLIISTHRGFFKFKRLPFGISFAPNFFQRTMDKILAGLPGVAWFIDDIIITGKTKEEHLKNLAAVLSRLEKFGVKSQISKCKWLQNSVQYLGHMIDKNGIHPTSEHLKAIKEMPSPSNTTELKSFLGSINYYSKFVRNLQSQCAPLHRLLAKSVRWEWTKEDEHLFVQLKERLLASTTLFHYNPELPLYVSCDASNVGIGGYLFHVVDGNEQPIAYTSRTLSNTEKRYSTLDKEALALYYTVSKFHQYLYGRRFILRSDHKPLSYLLGENKEIPKVAANRLTRWALALSAYNYSIEYTKGGDNKVADLLSRLPLPDPQANEDQNDKNSDIMHYGAHINQIKIDNLQLNRHRLKMETQKEPNLQKIIQFLERGWPQKKDLPEDLHTFFEKREELSYEAGILLWKGRLIIPWVLRKSVMTYLHLGHPGISAMKDIAQIHAWWPRMNAELESFVKNCASCQETRQREPEAPLFSWSVPEKPWTRLHIDFLEYSGKNWLIVVDATSKWLEVVMVNRTTAGVTIGHLREMFARFGLPAFIVSDNGPQFTAHEFQNFLKENGIKHIKSTPYHPRSNGLAERAVRTFKHRMEASKSQQQDLQWRSQNFLLSYRITPHRTTGRSPGEMLFGRRLLTSLDLLKPDVRNEVDKNLAIQKVHHDRVSKWRNFEEGEDVWILTESGNKNKYIKGVIEKKTGPVSYSVIAAGVRRRKHADQLRKA